MNNSWQWLIATNLEIAENLDFYFPPKYPKKLNIPPFALEGKPFKGLTFFSETND